MTNRIFLTESIFIEKVNLGYKAAGLKIENIKYFVSDTTGNEFGQYEKISEALDRVSEMLKVISE